MGALVVGFAKYHINGIFGGHFNLAVWQFSFVSPNLYDAV